MTRRLQDAAQAADLEILDDARAKETALLGQIATATAVVDPNDAIAARTAIEAYYAAAESITRRLIKGDTGETMVKDVEAMQAKQALATQAIAKAGHFDNEALGSAFAAAADAQATGARLRLAISLACVALVLALSLWISRGLYRSVDDLASGLRRFGDGDFASAIPIAGDDELGSVARSANQMAERLQHLNAERDRNDWLKTGIAGFVDELRGELEPAEVGERALGYLARYVGAPVGAIYIADPNRVLRPLATYGLAANTDAPRFAPGEGLLGEAARRDDITIVKAPAGALPIHSALTKCDPRELVLAPLVHTGKITGVLELGVLDTWTPARGELLMSVRESLAIAIEVARGRASTRALLAETQRQAAELLDARQGLEQKADELARASSVKSQFLANMSHELRTPLNAILGFSELLYDGAVPSDSPQHKEFVGDILTSGRHLLQLINDVLDLSKVEAGKLEFHPEKLQLSKTVSEVLGILRTTAANARVKIEPVLDSSVDAVVLDPARLKQVLYNLLSNAIKFTPEGGHVTVRTSAVGTDHLRVEVQDTGIGIDAEGLRRLFGEFQQLVGDGKKRGGTGLGLALTKRLVEAQGGTVGVHSVVGVGSTFHAILPRTQRRVNAPTIVPTSAASDGPSVLVIEDDKPRAINGISWGA